MFGKQRQTLRERFLAEQQDQLTKDARLLDPAEAYKALIAELDGESDPDWQERSDRAA